MRALALLRHDDALSFQFQIGPLDRDDADLKIHGELANGGNRLAFGPIADSDSLLDLLHDLEVHRALVGLRDREGAVHMSVYSVYTDARTGQAISEGLILLRARCNLFSDCFVDNLGEHA